METRGQGATEYLVVLAVVLVIALVSISLLGFFPGTSKETSMTASQIYWSGAAKPFKLSQGEYSGSAYRIVMENSEISAVTLTEVTVDGVSAKFGRAGAGSSSSLSFGPTEKMIVDITPPGGATCTAGQLKEMSLKFSYTSSAGVANTQTGEKKFLFSCSSSSGTGPTCANSGESCAALSCCSGLVCSAGTCQAPVECSEAGKSCENMNCCDGLTCNLELICSKCPNSGEKCTATSQCCSEVPYCVENACSEKCGGDSSRCTGNSDCCSGDGLVCTDGVCQKCATGGKYCSATAQCCSEVPYCVENACSEKCGGEGNACTGSGDCCEKLVCLKGKCSPSG